MQGLTSGTTHTRRSILATAAASPRGQPLHLSLKVGPGTFGHIQRASSWGPDLTTRDGITEGSIIKTSRRIPT